MLEVQVADVLDARFESLAAVEDVDVIDADFG